MPPYTLLILLLVIVICAFAYMRYRTSSEKRVREKKRNQYNDRI